MLTQHSPLRLIINISRSLSFAHPENPHAMWSHMKAEERWGSDRTIQNWRPITLKNRHKFTCAVLRLSNPARQRYQTPKTTERWYINATRLGSPSPAVQHRCDKMGYIYIYIDTHITYILCIPCISPYSHPKFEGFPWFYDFSPKFSDTARERDGFPWPSWILRQGEVARLRRHSPWCTLGQLTGCG